MTPEQYLAQITKQLREQGLTDDQARIILDTVNGYGLARYTAGYTDCKHTASHLQRGRKG